jgi:hypothetical protein
MTPTSTDEEIARRLVEMFDSAARPISSGEAQDRAGSLDLSLSQPQSKVRNLPAQRARDVVLASLNHKGAVALVLVVSAAAVIIPLALRSPTALPAASGPPVVAPPVDLGATPAGWAPVPFERAQISAPSDWLLNVDLPSGYSPCTSQFGFGWISLGSFISWRPRSCGSRATDVALVPAPASPPPGATKQLVNGIPTWLSSSPPPIHAAGGPAPTVGGPVLSEDATGLGVEVIAEGPLARRVLETLTYSPAAVVVDSSRIATPHGWHAVTAEGITFEVPSSWPVESQAVWSRGCGPAGASYEVLLSTGQRSRATCSQPPPGPATAAAGEGQPVVAVGPAAVSAASGQGASRSVGPCRVLNGLKACLSFSTGFRSPDFLTVEIYESEPHGFAPAPAPAPLMIGLGTSGTIAVAILDSVRSA